MMSDINRILPKCPKCGRYYSEPPAISRTDNKTEICSMCGMKEAISNWFENTNQPKEGVGITN